MQTSSSFISETHPSNFSFSSLFLKEVRSLYFGTSRVSVALASFWSTLRGVNNTGLDSTLFDGRFSVGTASGNSFLQESTIFHKRFKLQSVKITNNIKKESTA